MRCLRTPPPLPPQPSQILTTKRVPKPLIPYTPPSVNNRGQITKNPTTTNPQNTYSNSTAMPQIGIEIKQMQGVESDGMVRSYREHRDFRRPASVRGVLVLSRQQFLVCTSKRITSRRLAVDKSEYNLELGRQSTMSRQKFN